MKPMRMVKSEGTSMWMCSAMVVVVVVVIDVKAMKSSMERGIRNKYDCKLLLLLLLLVHGRLMQRPGDRIIFSSFFGIADG
mmetsp:Transcript_25856/g.39686  ORF Transcript_25856/g.39686 Transcript_25856/m.39686 type:complete len:81 (-) Transcript_25856:51-293(-)